MLDDIRNWASFAFLVLGGVIALRTFVLNQRQRKLENSFRLTDLFAKSITSSDVKAWSAIRIASSEQAGAKTGFFIDDRKQQVPFSSLFAPGLFSQERTIERLCELFDLVGYEFLRGTLEIRLFYFEYGEYIETVHYWASYVNGNTDFIKKTYPSFHKMYTRNKRRFLKLPRKSILQLE